MKNEKIVCKVVKSLKEIPEYKKLVKANWVFSFYDSGDDFAFYEARVSGYKVQMSIRSKMPDCLFSTNDLESLLSKDNLKRYHDIHFSPLEDGSIYHHTVILSDDLKRMKADYNRMLKAFNDFSFSLKEYLNEENND